MIEHHSHKIQNAIQRELFMAQKSIKIAVAWFTNDLLFMPLVMKAESGVAVEIILNKDSINDPMSSGLDFDALVRAGGVVRWNDSERLLHDKFCVIDETIVISGSYNWTKKAEYNDESVTIVREEQDYIQSYLDKFLKLQNKYTNIYIAPILEVSLENDVSNEEFIPQEVEPVIDLQVEGNDIFSQFYNKFYESEEKNKSVDYQLYILSNLINEKLDYIKRSKLNVIKYYVQHNGVPQDIKMSLLFYFDDCAGAEGVQPYGITEFKNFQKGGYWKLLCTSGDIRKEEEFTLQNRRRLRTYEPLVPYFEIYKEIYPIHLVQAVSINKKERDFYFEYVDWKMVVKHDDSEEYSRYGNIKIAGKFPVIVCKDDNGEYFWLSLDDLTNFKRECRRNSDRTFFGNNITENTFDLFWRFPINGNKYPRHLSKSFEDMFEYFSIFDKPNIVKLIDVDSLNDVDVKYADAENKEIVFRKTISNNYTLAIQELQTQWNDISDQRKIISIFNRFDSIHLKIVENTMYNYCIFKSIVVR